MDTLRPGILAPDFPLPPAPGQLATRLTDLRGQPIVIAFSPPGWDPARAEGLAQIRRLFAQAGFPGELLGFSQEGTWCQATFSDESVRFPFLTHAEMDNGVAAEYGVAGKQATFVLDEGGVIRWMHVAAPGTSLRNEDVLAALRTLGPVQEGKDVARDSDGGRGETRLTRRTFLAAALGIVLALNLSPPSTPDAEALASAPDNKFALTPLDTGTVPVMLHVNGTDQAVQIEPRVTLLDALRERLNLTGSKKGCDHGQCGACTVHVDGRRVLSCLTLAVTCPGKKITTIEGLASGDTLHPMQAAFVQHDGFQCGFCTPGQIMSAVALLSEPVGPEDADVRENMSGNICRCGAYPNIVAAVQDVRKGGSNAPV